MRQLGSYTLHRASPHDAPEILALIGQVLQSYGIQPNPQTTERDLVDLTKHYGGERGDFFVLRDGTNIIGTVAWLRETAEACELCRMYLAETYRGHGLGRALLNHCLQEAKARGFKEVRLKTASVLHEAISLYQRAGFTTVEGQSRCGNCDVMMRKRLDG